MSSDGPSIAKLGAGVGGCSAAPWSGTGFRILDASSIVSAADRHES
jgi:hypothetical protein